MGGHLGRFFEVFLLHMHIFVVNLKEIMIFFSILAGKPFKLYLHDFNLILFYLFKHRQVLDELQGEKECHHSYEGVIKNLFFFV